MRLGIRLGNLGAVAVSRGLPDEASRVLLEGLAVAERTGDRPGLAIVLCNLGQAQVAAGRTDEGVVHLNRSLALCDELDLHRMAVAALAELALFSCFRYHERLGVQMRGNQLSRIALAFARETAKSPTARLCAACVEVLDVSGAGITLMGGDQAGPICVSDSSIAELEDLQFMIGQGPCRGAYRSGQSVHALRLDECAFVRWLELLDAAAAGVLRTRCRRDVVGDRRVDLADQSAGAVPSPKSAGLHPRAVFLIASECKFLLE